MCVKKIYEWQPQYSPKDLERSLLSESLILEKLAKLDNFCEIFGKIELILRLIWLNFQDNDLRNEKITWQLIKIINTRALLFERQFKTIHLVKTKEPRTRLEKSVKISKFSQIF